MKAKEKRKRTPHTHDLESALQIVDPTLTFDTTLTVEECVARLKDAAFNSVDQRLSIRATEERFVVEIIDPAQAGKFKPNENWLARFEGQFRAVHGKTRIWGAVVENPQVRRSLNQGSTGTFFMLSFFAVLAFAMAIIVEREPEAEGSILFIACVGLGLVFLALIIPITNTRRYLNAFEPQVDELKRLVERTLWVPSGESE